MSVVSEYKAIRKALLDQISRLRRAGYTVDIEVPKIPKRPTKGSIRRLKKIKDNVWSHVSYKGAKGYGAKRKRAQERAAQRPKKPRKPKEPKKPEEEPTTATEPEPEPETFPEQEPGPEPEPEPEPPEEWTEWESDYSDYIPPEGEIIERELRRLISDGQADDDSNIRKKADYVERQVERVINEIGKNEFYKNLVATDPDVVEHAEKIIYYIGFYDEDRRTHYLYEMMKFGEMLTEKEARETEGFMYPDEGEDWTEGSWNDLFGAVDDYE
ncbi:MAG: hypothetical protein J6S49_08925 [Erysipelotrichaceae bacterium]|nr:hypothetical protein [Erysipelotrichaceae bacterium]